MVTSADVYLGRFTAGGIYRLPWAASKDGKPWDLTAGSVALTFIPPDGSPPFVRQAVPDDAANGLFYYDTAPEDLYVSGGWGLEVTVTDGPTVEPYPYPIRLFVWPAPGAAAGAPPPAAGYVASLNGRTGAVTLTGADVEAALPPTGTPGTVGDAAHYPVITTDAEGRVTNAVAQALPSATTDHAALSHLDFASAGHTGFAPSARQVLAGTGLAGGGDLSADRTLSMPSVGTPGSYGDATHFTTLTTDAQGRVTAAAARPVPAAGVTSVGLTVPGVIFASPVAGSPVTGAGTLALAMLTQAANAVLAGPASGAAAAPSFRALAAADLPAGVALTGAANVFTAAQSGPFGSGVNNERWGAGSGNGSAAGNNNVALGQGALAALAAGSGNTAVGQGAMVLSAGSSNNTAVGQGALSANVTGNNNVALGVTALSACLAGAGNLAIGAGACNHITSGNSNVGVGGSALGAVSTQGSNVAVGASAQANAAGSNNTSVGTNTLVNASGNNNTALGQGAGNATLTTGAGNTLLGQGTDALAAGTVGGVALGQGALCGSGECAFGPVLNVQTSYTKSSTNAVRARADLTDSAVDNTDATRKYRRVLNAWDTLAREVVRLEATGTAAAVGFLGAAAVTRRTVNAACTDLASAVALTNQLRQLLIDLGFAQ